MFNLPIELQNLVWSFVGEHPVAKCIRELANDCYKSCDLVWDDDYTNIVMPFNNWYFNVGRTECMIEMERINSRFVKLFGRPKPSFLDMHFHFQPEFYNLEVLQLGTEGCEMCGIYLDIIARDNYGGYCENCYATEHGIET
jgi:hypothetical protein